MNNETLNLNLVEQRYGAEYIDGICLSRRIALEIDKDPLRINNYINEPTIISICEDRDSSCLNRTKEAEALSYGDAGVFLSFPGSSLAGQAIREMANDEQKNMFFDTVAKLRCTTFAAITEPDHGSDVASIETKLEKIDEDHYSMTGEKCFITHGADGKIGVAIARTSDGPFGITGVLLTPELLKCGEEEGTLERDFLPVVGVKGTCLAQLEFRNFIVPTQNILGQHLRLVRRGMLAIIRTFNMMRPCVAGFVLGQAQAIVDYVSCCFEPLSQSTQRLLATLNADLASARENLYESARRVQLKPNESSYVSIAKGQITNLVERICSTLTDELNPAMFCEHPLLLKWFRDCYGFEYMEGTTNMQKRNVYRKYLRGKSIRTT